MNTYIQEIHYVINNEERAIKNTLGDPPAAGLLEHPGYLISLVGMSIRITT
jgi:hypothetical protein